MGKPIDKHKPTKNLDELLDHLNKGGDDLDAFEQEALEGFATLENKQEAYQMKQRLDERMEEKLAEKRKPLFIYWSAAAGLALIIGLVFMMNSNKDLNSEVGLADNSIVSEKLVESDANNAAAPPAELKQEDMKASGGLSGKANAQGSASSNQAYKQLGPMQKSAEEQNYATTKESPVTLAEAANEPEKDADKGYNEDSKRSDNSKLDDMVADNKNQNTKTVPENAAAAGSASNKDSNGDMLKKAADKSSKEEEESEPKATEYFTARKLKKEKEKSGSRTETKPAGEIEGSFEKSTIKTANLSIKDSELKAKIDKFFTDKDYKRSFICTLTINSDDKVESVVFQNPELFHKGEQKEISDFFKKLKCFKNHEFAVYSTYVVNYKVQ